MREMKNSGVEWIGEIPAEWELNEIFQVVEQVKNKNVHLVEKNLLSLSYGKIKRKDIENNEGLLPASFDSYNVIEKDDIVLRLTDLQNDHKSLRVGLSKERGIITSAYVTLRPNEHIVPLYLYYLLYSFDIIKGFYGMGAGVRQSLKYDEVKTIKISSPDIYEQHRIASYLDKKCSNIDAIITKNEQIIEKLKAYKSSLITEKVTKGLNPDVEMKDSGVEWIGEIPADWSYGRIKYNYYLKGRIGWQGLKASEFIDDGPYLVTGTDFINGEINWESCYHISEERYNEAPEIHVKVGDLLITKDGTVGKVAFIKTKPDKVSLNSHLLIMRSLNNSYSNRFLFWIIQSNVFELYFQLTQSGSIMASLSQEKINNFSFPLPPLSEQTAIAAYLDKKCSIIDSNIAKRELINAKLAEYKKSLIYEVVTGKKEII